MLDQKTLSEFIRDLSWSGLHNTTDGTEKVQAMLKEWCEKHQFQTVTQLCKGVAVQLLAYPDLNQTPVARLLKSYGQLFSGMDVGILGRDLFTYSLIKGNKEVREVVIQTLLEWEDQEQTGAWLEILESHYSRELDSELRTYIRNSIPTVETGSQKILIYGYQDTINTILKLFPGGPESVQDLTPVSNSVYLDEDMGRVYFWCTHEKTPWGFTLSEISEGFFILEGSF